MLYHACSTSDLQLQLCRSFYSCITSMLRVLWGVFTVMPQLYIYMAFKIHLNVLEICFNFPQLLANLKFVTLLLQPSKYQSYNSVSPHLTYFRAFRTACLTCVLGDKFSGSPYIAQAGLKLLDLNDPPALSSWVLEVGISHHARLWLARCLLRLL